MNFNGIRILGNYVTTIALLLSIIANKSKLLNFCAQMPLPLPLSASLCLSLPLFASLCLGRYKKEPINTAYSGEHQITYAIHPLASILSLEEMILKYMNKLLTSYHIPEK